MAKTIQETTLEHVELRPHFKTLQLENPNYFGNLKESKQKAAILIAGNTFYEELKCVSYHPSTQILNAAILLKQGAGYSGGPCTNGSFEYVRFYLDYDRNGTWVDEGFMGTNVHDLSFQEDLCYNVQLKITPDKKSCCDDPAVLPRVRAILSWNSIPPANQPNWTPVWGNTLETSIQIAPSKSLWCLIKHGVKIDEVAKLKLLENIEKIQFPVPPLPDPGPLSLQYVKAIYKDKVEDTRIVLKQINDLSLDTDLATSPQKLNLEGIKWAELIDKVKLLKFNISYEEVKCIALNRELSTLHASVVIKKPVGYLGDLCKAGSKEYVAFYLDFGSGYIYMGTSSIIVHDISTIPPEGLWYNISLPVFLEPYQKAWCESGKAKAKAILSWNAPPPPNNPNYVAAYGDWEECFVEIKSLPAGVQPGKTMITLESVGRMPVSPIVANSKINPVSGLANGTNVGSTFTAVDSPFYGNVSIKGPVFNTGGASYKYRIMLKKPSDSSFYPVTNTVTVQTNTLGIISPDILLTPDLQGWIDYLGVSGLTGIVENYLGYVYTVENGLHSIYVELKNAGTNVIVNSTFIVNFMADINAPVVTVDIDGGKCKTYKKGTKMTGTFSMTDLVNPHCLSLSLSLLPAAETNGTLPKITSPIVGGNTMSYGVNLPGNGTSGTWEIDTSNMNPCGYVLRIEGNDRTIVHSNYIGLYDNDDKGFCLID